MKNWDITFAVVLFEVFFLALASAQAPAAGPPPAEGPPAEGADDGRKYELEIQKVLLVNETDFVIFKGLKVKRYNKTS